MAHIPNLRQRPKAAKSFPYIDTLFDYEPPAFRGLQRERVTITCVDSAGELLPLPADPSELANPIPNPVEIRIVVDWRSRSGHPHRVTAATFHRL